GTLGLEISDDGLWAELELTVKVKASAEIAALCSRTFVTEGIGKNARPLYIVPWDPTAEMNQSEDERLYCRSLLVERVFVYAMSVVGRADPPDTVTLEGDEALKSATFGVASKWEAVELDKLRAVVSRRIYATLNRGDLRGKVELHGKRVELSLENAEDQREALNLLSRARIDLAVKEIG